MIEIKENRSDPPELVRFRVSNPGSSWNDPAFSPIRTLIRHQLNIEQENLCVYCEGSLDMDDGHVEHLQPRTHDPSLTFVYDNLAHSCSNQNHCGHYKQNNNLPVKPRIGCNRFFSMSVLDGTMSPTVGLADDERSGASDTLRILGLNTPSLAWQRKRYCDILVNLARYSNMSEVKEFITSIPFRWTLGGLFS
ncbi:MAG: retron system putative HNH endonuclease [Vulcanimicrobiota bacterium]